MVYWEEKSWPVIPACVVKAIRNESLEESGEYAGFKPVEADLNYTLEINNLGF